MGPGLSERLRVRFVVAFFVALNATALTLIWPTLNADATEITPGARETLIKLLHLVPAPVGTTKDPTATACGQPTDYCVDGGTMSAPAVLARSAASLRAHTAVLVGQDCAGRPEASGAFCSQQLQFGGYPFVLHAITRPSPLGTAGTVVFTSFDETREPVRSAGLEAAQVRRGLPASWTGELRCTLLVTDGCLDYEATLTGTAGIADATVALRRSLDKAGYRVGVLRCFRRTSQGQPGCNLGASRFRGDFGRDAVELDAQLRQSGSGFTAELSVRATPA